MKSKKWVIVLLLFFTFFPTLQAQSSSYKSDFVVDGCNIGAEGLAVGACSKDGKHFCKASSEPGARPILQNTLIDSGACGSGAPGATQCCPSGYVCNGTTVTCTQRKANCGSWDTKKKCEDNSCTWIVKGTGGVCVDRPTDYSCSVYTTQEACTRDVWNLGKTGIGTDICATTYNANYDSLTKGFVVAPNSCGCAWDAGACKLRYEIADDIYNKNIEPRNKVTCLKTFNAGTCNSGTQQVSWTAANKGSTFSKNISEVLTKGACTTGTGERTCGEPVFKLPIYSTQALIATILLLITYYGITNKRKEE